MSDILIKGMEMPNVCAYCIIDSSECNLHSSVNIWRERHPDCQLIELPPHGRLIDIKSVEDGKFVTVGNDYQRWWNGALESVIDNAPTVIEAEGSKT